MALSTDVRVFQIKESPFDGAPFGVRFESTDTPYTFIQRQLAHFNTPAGAAAFLSIPEREEDSPLELARTVPVEVPLDIPFLPSLTANVPVYNFAFAKVRFRALYFHRPLHCGLRVVLHVPPQKALTPHRRKRTFLCYLNRTYMCYLHSVNP